jgi:prevent-host-death family protein
VKTVNTHEAKTQLSRLLKRVTLGEQVIIASRGSAVARLVPITETESHRGLGMFEGEFVVPDDFDATLPADFLSTREGKCKRTCKEK